MITEDLLSKIVNMQFEMIGIDLRLETIPEDNIIIVGKKKELWYEVHKFESEEQYKEWRSWAESIVRNEKDMNYIDFRYGMVYRYKKEGLLF